MVAAPLMTTPAYAGADTAGVGGGADRLRSRNGLWIGIGSAPLEILPADYEIFERLLGEIQAAWSNEDVAQLHTLATPEMVSISPAISRRTAPETQINKVSGTKLLQGDLAEAWREGDIDYATVAMRFSMIDRTVDRTTGRLVGGSGRPHGSHGSVDLRRPHGGNWEIFGDPADPDSWLHRKEDEESVATDLAAPFLFG